MYTVTTSVNSKYPRQTPIHYFQQRKRQQHDDEISTVHNLCNTKVMNKRYGIISLTDIADDRRQLLQDINSFSIAHAKESTGYETHSSHNFQCDTYVCGDSENIYENLKELNYDASSESSTQTGYGRIRNYYCEENIYENICEACGRIYDETCDFCTDEIECTVKSVRKGLIPKIWNNLKNSKSSSKILRKQSSKKLNQKIEIVHNVNGTDNVFKTNATFNLEEMCQMRNELIKEQQKTASALNESSGVDDIRLAEDNQEVIYENVILPIQETNNCAVNEWIKNILKETTDYDEHIQYNVKCIPSRTFNCYDFNCDGNSEKENLSNSMARRVSVRDFILTWETLCKSNTMQNTSEKHKLTKEAPPITITWNEQTNESEPDEMELKGISVMEEKNNENLQEIFNKLTQNINIDPLMLVNTDDNQKTMNTSNCLNRYQSNCLSAVNEITNLKKKPKNITKVTGVRVTDKKSLYTFLAINKCLLSISLNTITLTYDKSWKIILYHLRASQQGVKYLSYDKNFENSKKKALEVPVKRLKRMLKRHSTCPHFADVDQTKESEAHHKRPDTSVVLRQRCRRRVLTFPLTNSMIIDLPEPSPKNLNRKLEIYQPIWICSTFESAAPPSPGENLYESFEKYNQTAQDDHNWESADEDFRSANDLMDLVDTNRSNVNNMPPVTEVPSLPRNYTKVEILYSQENPDLNKIIFPTEENPIGKPPIKQRQPVSRGPAIERGFQIKQREPQQTRFYLTDANIPAKLIRDSPKTVKSKQVFNPDTVSDSVKAYFESIRNPKNVEDEEDVDIYLPEKVDVHLKQTDVEKVRSNNGGSLAKKFSFKSRKGGNKEETKQTDFSYGRYKVVENLSGTNKQTTVKLRTRKDGTTDLKTRTQRRLSIQEDRSSSKAPLSNLHRAKSEMKLSDLQDNESESSNSGVSFKDRFFRKFKQIFKPQNSDFKLSHEQLDNHVFGNSIAKLDKNLDWPNVPLFVTECIKILEQNDMIVTHGLYRTSGNKNVIDELRKKINQGSSKSKRRYECLKNQEVNTLAGLLKQFFRELETPIISEEIAKKCISSVANDVTEQSLKDHIHEIQDPEFSTLKYLISHLKRVSEFSEENKMDTLNLSIVWGPCIFKSIHSVDAIQSGNIVKINQVLRALIDNYEFIFE